MAQESADLFIIGAGAGGRIYTRSIYAKMSVVMENRRVQVQGSTSPPMTLIEQVHANFRSRIRVNLLHPPNQRGDSSSTLTR